MWKIHNKYYNLNDFMDKHPGGKQILESCKNLDATNSFESYHTFSDMKKISSIMTKYEIDPEEKSIESEKYTFNNNEFYREVQREVNKYFINKSTKWTNNYLILFLITFITYIYTFCYTFLGVNNNYQLRILTSIISASLLLSFSFQVFHDATHYAVSKNKFINEFISQIGGGLLLWDWKIWIKHHSIYHHSFTGNYKLDPDMKHTHPLFKKSEESNACIIKNPLIISLSMSIIPGIFVGQIYSYLLGLYRRKLWGFKINSSKTILEWIIFIGKFYIMSHNKDYLLMLIYFISLNINYSIAILPDHDQYETILNKDIKISDWGETQVRNSGNFCPENKIYTRMYGSINYQIEHHLFPSLCSYHLPEISKIVKKVCQKHDIKYVSNSTLFGAYMSVINNFYKINNKNC
jgi:fatty acid desaturase